MKVHYQKQELADWIRRRLGAPILNLNMLTTEQIDDCIDEAVLYFGEFAGGIGNEKQFILIESVPYEEEFPGGIYCDENNNEESLEKDCQRPSISTECVEPSSANSSGTSGSRDIIDPDHPNKKTHKFLQYKHEYQLPRSVVAISDRLPFGGEFTGAFGQEEQDILRYSFTAGAVPGMAGAAGVGIAGPGGFGGAALFMGNYVPGFGSIGNYGNRGSAQRTGGFGIDMVSYELGLQYLEMFRQRYTIRMDVQFLEAQRKVRFSPGPPEKGVIILGAWARVPDPYLYSEIWVRRYALAYCKIQIGYNLKKYDGMTFPGGVKLNGDFYLEEGKEELQKLEDELRDNKYGEPPVFFFG